MGAVTKLKRIDLNRELTDELTACVQSIFKGGFGIEVELKESHIGTDQIAVADVSGVVGMIQKDFEANLILSFQQDVIFDILKRVYKNEFVAVNDIVQEGTAELANMIFGQLKLKMNERGHGLKMALPNVVVGSGHNIHCPKNCQSLMTVFRYDGDKEFKLFIARQDS